MTKVYSKWKSLIFEELEPRLLFSADGAEALAADVVEQTVEEQPVIIIDSASEVQTETITIDQSAEEAVAVATETAAPAVDSNTESEPEPGAPAVEDAIETDTADAEKQQTPAADQTVPDGQTESVGESTPVFYVDSDSSVDVSQDLSSEDQQADYLSLPMSFEQNLGQTDEQVDFFARGSGYTAYLSDGDAILALGDGTSQHVIRLDLVGANSDVSVNGEDELDSRSHYLIGSDQSNWQTDVANFRSVEYADVYDGIDVRYYGNQRQLEYDFIVAAGADTSLIQLSFEGAESISVNNQGDLVITLAEADTISFKAPVSYQLAEDGTREEIASSYVIHEDSSVGFSLGEYDANHVLVIDPILNYSTLLGGTGNDTAFSITEDGNGDIYILGTTSSADFPDATGSLAGTSDAYVSKLRPNGSGSADLIYTTYIGGSGSEYGSGSIQVNGAGEAVFLGSTTSADLYTSSGAYDTSLGGGTDAFVAKLNATGTALLYSTYYGGSASSEAAGALAMDSAGNVYITGQTLSNNLPRVNAYDSSFTGSSDIYVAKLTLAGGGSSDLLYSTYLGGGTDYERSNGIAVDDSGKVYLTGPAFSGHPTTVGAFQTVIEGSSDAFLSIIDTTISGAGGLVYSTFLGGSGSEEGFDVQYLASKGLVYIAGSTSSTNFDTTAGAYSETSKGGWDAFLAVIDPSGNGAGDLIYSSYLGGIGSDFAEGLHVDSSGTAYITGRTSGGLITVNPTQSTFGGGSNDAFVATLRPASFGSSDLTFSTYLGGSGTDYGKEIIVNSSGDFYVTGYTTDSNSFPTTSGAYDETGNGGDDAFITRFALNEVNDAPTFSIGDGIVTTGIGAGSDNGYSVAMQADGKILVAGSSFDGVNYDFALVRYNSDGSLDTSFSTDGKLTTSIGAGSAYGQSVAVQTDGKILVGGYATGTFGDEYALARYNSDGTLDTSFSTDGIVTTSFGLGDAYGKSLTLQADGKILVSGYYFSGAANLLSLARYNAMVRSTPASRVTACSRHLLAASTTTVLTSLSSRTARSWWSAAPRRVEHSTLPSPATTAAAISIQRSRETGS